MTRDKRETGSRPGWRGPGLTKAVKGSQKPKASKGKENKPLTQSEAGESLIPAELQQQILNIYKHAFPDLSEGGAEALKPVLQEVKQALFERDFERAFGRQDYLEAYAFRWSPSRALCYISILVNLQDHLLDVLLFRSIAGGKRVGADEAATVDVGQRNANPKIHVACLGGGAAEVMAFGGLLKYFNHAPEPVAQKAESSSISEAVGAMRLQHDSPPEKISILLLDTAAWGDVIQKLSSALTTAPALSKYASASARASSTPLIPPGTLSATFQRADLLSSSATGLKEYFGQGRLLITLLFTLNELYASSIAATTAFLLNLTAATAGGSLLLVVDSPGSYSEALVGKEDKKYPMRWLLDRTLLGAKGSVSGEDDEPEWEKLVADESRWFRMPEELRYPISLENMRYQIHLFRRL